MLPSILARQLQTGIGDYIDTTFPMTNAPFKGSVQKMLRKKDAVYHEPYIAVRLPLRVEGSMPTCFDAIHPEYLPYVHQARAFGRLTGDDGRSTLIATGTGSGKTECFLYPILEYCYQHRGEPGIKALIIYPMNALASDQARRIAGLIYHSPELKGNVTVGMYVGGQDHTPARMMREDGVITDHETLLGSPPDILMTNYKMLDYLLVRPKDARLWRDNRPESLKYIAVDELHTFDGAQGTDLACLLRRLKQRLGIFPGYLCCIGTSATMGSGERQTEIVDYARKIFGEPFEGGALITEDRLGPKEFFGGWEITQFAIPSAEDAARLAALVDEDDADAYLRTAAAAWFPDRYGPSSGEDRPESVHEAAYGARRETTDALLKPEEDGDVNCAGREREDVLTDAGRIELGNLLMHHSLMQSVIALTGSSYWQASAIAQELSGRYPDLAASGDPEGVLASLFALISHARTGAPGALRPFLQVQVQLWMREQRRLVARVGAGEVDYALAPDLNRQQAKRYLPVVNCRDCGITGWVSILSERGNASMTNLDAFYNTYFKSDRRVAMLFPMSHEERIPGLSPGRVCPECLQFTAGPEGPENCPACGTRMVDVQYPNPVRTTGGQHPQYICPCCGSRRGLSLMGVRSATQISASISQVFASRFNDDKKTLAFSDNVQDAAYRAGFFNSRTWRFGLRTAMEQYLQNGGAGLSLSAFQDGFLTYWHARMDDETFVSYFIAPNMTWMHAYEDMLEKRRLGKGGQAGSLMKDIESRLRYEILLEFGLAGRIGRTLEKSSCAVISFDPEDIRAIAEAVQQRTVSELGILTREPQDTFARMVLGYLDLMRRSGAFDDAVFHEFILHDGQPYMLSNDRNRWLPGLQSGRNTPRFPAEHVGSGRKAPGFDEVSSDKYVKWLESCCTEVLVEEGNLALISRFIIGEAVKRGVVLRTASSANYKVYALNKDRVYITDEVRQMRCDTCGAMHAVPAVHAALWKDAPCSRPACGGSLAPVSSDGGYYGKLYRSGDLARINAKEHTGLLERPDRESLETDFKRQKEDRAVWDPNVLSCTPTLEMGIDIGDLSTVILCSMPPSQSQFLQRTGRAGRRDGNALTLAVANAKPHDLYYYQDPMDMIQGSVLPPQVFLKASAVLERQFVAYSMDSWVKTGIPDKAIPDRVGVILQKLERRPADVFPFNFLGFVQRRRTMLINSFLQMFAGELDQSAEEELREFVRPGTSQNSPMYVRILDAFEDLKRQKESLKKSVQELQEMISGLEARPKDRSFDEEIGELRSEKKALMGVLRELTRKNVFNFLSDEGLLPNYAFPEAGIVLKAILYRKSEEPSASPQPKRRYEKMVYEYNRAASSAIREFAPGNSFYCGGRKLTVDQVDLTTAQAARWRLCPNCSHAQLEEAGRSTAACPQCGSPSWADAGQVRDMLKVQMVYSSMDYTRSLISDDSDDRTTVFYCRQLLVDVDEEHDISSAYRMDNEEFPFGYEFVRKATLREINFGESDLSGEKLCVSGVEEVRKGFKICKFCGKILPEHPTAKDHTQYCRTRRDSSLTQESSYEQCLFLYREFTTEILRLLVPATTMDSTAVKLESFVAAFMLGMKEYFGNVDHLRAAVCEVPVPDADYRKQYLVIYDSVPGGTGYLKQLMHEENALTQIFEKSLRVMENCSCRSDPSRDGCYHCLYAYRQSQKIGNISRAAAVRMLKSILSGKENIQKIRKMGDIPVNPLFESELEQRFMEAVRFRAGAANVSDIIRNGKHAYYVRFAAPEGAPAAPGAAGRKAGAGAAGSTASGSAAPGGLSGAPSTAGGISWEIEPQVSLDASCGVAIPCRPDFVFWPVSAPGHLPVAVFTDGFLYHKDIVTEDTLKREAIRRSGRFRVWALSYKDVQSVFESQGDYCTPVLDAMRMPYGQVMYQGAVGRSGADVLHPDKLSSFDLLMAYVQLPEAEEVFRAQAGAYSLSLLQPTWIHNRLAFGNWKQSVDQVNEQTHFTKSDFRLGSAFYGTWIPRDTGAHLAIHAGIPAAVLKGNPAAPAAVCAILEDRPGSRTDSYEKEWNGFWRFWNVMQFAAEFAAVSMPGLERMDYLTLPLPAERAPQVQESGASAEPEGGTAESWKAVMELLFGEEEKAFAAAAAAAGIPAPSEDEIGYEVEGAGGEVTAAIDMAWPDRKIAFLSAENPADREALEALGWRVITMMDVADLKEIFGM